MALLFRFNYIEERFTFRCLRFESLSLSLEAELIQSFLGEQRKGWRHFCRHNQNCGKAIGSEKAVLSTKMTADEEWLLPRGCQGLVVYRHEHSLNVCREDGRASRGWDGMRWKSSNHVDTKSKEEKQTSPMKTKRRQRKVLQYSPDRASVGSFWWSETSKVCLAGTTVRDCFGVRLKTGSSSHLKAIKTRNDLMRKVETFL